MGLLKHESRVLNYLCISICMLHLNCLAQSVSEIGGNPKVGPWTHVYGHASGLKMVPLNSHGRVSY